jgi:hypothetical protein
MRSVKHRYLCVCGGVLLLGVARQGHTAVTREPSEDPQEEHGVVLSIGVPDRVLVAPETRVFDITLRLENRTQEPIYVSPAIGQMGSTLEILARARHGSGLPTGLHHATRSAAYGFEDLFELKPHRDLELEMTLPYPSEFPSGETEIEIWAEYDCREMKLIDPRAFGAVLKSEPVIAHIVFLK